jgi:hypothetical protein
MRVAIVHHHLHPGGVTRIIEHAVTALVAGGVDVAVLSGQAPDSGQHWPVPVQVIAGLAYEEQRSAVSPRQLADDMQAAVRSALGAPPDIWHLHNHSLGKNLALPQSIGMLAEEGQRLLLQLHDFAEDGRSGNYRRLRAVVGEGDGSLLTRRLYPQAGQVHYAVLNGRDLELLAAAGMLRERLHDLPNPVSLQLADTEQEVTTDGRLWLYPTRAIRRKNLGEFLLWAAVAPAGDRFATTLGPRNPAERPIYEYWRKLAVELALPVEFELGSQPGVRFESLLHSAHAMVTTSVAEGFGMAFLEPWLAGRAVAGRNLAEITDEFVAVGVELPHLYARLDVPLEWLGEQLLEQRVREALQRDWSAYGRSLQADDPQRALAAWIVDRHVDIGRLDEPLQESIIRRVRTSEAARQELRPASLPDPGDDRMVIDANRAAVIGQFGLDAYGPRLLDIYAQILASPAEPLETLPGEAVLEQFLAPERLCLLRS